jgi:acetyl-CoA decarbonylase/synthase complex subunit delta
VELGADLVCLRLAGTHPDGGDRSPEQAVATVKAVLAAVNVPLIIWGCGVEEKDNAVLPKCSEAAKGENCLFGSITQKNYRTLVAACLADGHKLIAESPLDINIAKQTNILAHDVGFPLENIVIFPTTAAMGYGFEYVYSIMERSRLAGLGGDQLLMQPLLCDVGTEAWRAKEATAAEEVLAGFGPAKERGVLWETLTATNYLQAGADLLVMRHPQAVAAVRKAIDRLCAPATA